MIGTATAGSEFKPRHVYLVDGSGYVFRAFHALPPMTRPDGTPVNAVYGFTTMLMKLISESDADCIAVIFDAARATFRNEIYPQYKAHRLEPPEELIPQFPLVREAARAFNLPAIEQGGYEADDLIATYARLAREAGAKVTIVSSDKDLMQLVRDGIEMLDPIKGRPIGPAEVAEKFGVPPEKVVDVQALAGDSVDNVPGVPGIGVKTAAQLINEYGDLEALLARAGEIKQPKRRESLQQHAEQARISKKLVLLEDHVPLEVPLAALTVHEPDHDKLVAFLKEQTFRSILARVESQAGAKPAAPQARTVTGAASSAPEALRAPSAHIPAAPLGQNYELVQSEEALAPWIARALAAGIVAVDTETTSLDATQARLVGVSLSLEPGEARGACEACYVPLGHKAPQHQGTLDLGENAAREAPKQMELKRALEMLKPLLEDPTVLKIGHNIKYDMVVLARYGIAIAPIDDTMLISYVLAAGLHGHGMDELAKLHLDHDTIKYKDVTGSGKGQIGFDEVALDKACAYAAEDADVTLRLWLVLKPQLLAERLASVYETIERPLVPVIVAMERHGIKVDRAELKRLSEDFATRLAELECQIHKLAGESFNVGSPKQLGEILFERMSLAGGRKAKTGAYVTDADVLEELAAQGHDLPARVLDWRQLQKLKSTYADALVEQINPETGRVHTSYGMAIASTGRLSSTDPNLQNIPVRTEEGRRIRRAFVAEPGWKLVSLDYSQIELRLLAHVADIQALERAFKEGIDIHALTASQVFGVPVEGMDPMVRRKAKAINFGIVYGISPFGLARQLGIPQAEAADYIKAYFARYPGIRDYMERTKELCRKDGYVKTAFGRRIYVRGIKDQNPARRGFAERAAINAPIQGGAADIIKRAMIRVPDALAEAGLSARMLLQVHDELVFEVREAEVEATIKAMRKVMEGAAPLKVPLVVDAGVADNWADAH
ncbi:MAG TPA: DNA polymerase I [Alphaproteobacteria bacterium]|nr:DNA polymerase I [Alphaproteobacteria bacterium]